jgi:glycosyltransferase involved in cell wall biosynthesis
MKMKLSIIVPVYNVEQYLQKCIDSILNQTMNDFELLLIDDGSTDSSGRICDEYAGKDSRIIACHITNGGPANARNTALKRAAGEYIGFVDSDDWIEPDMYETLCKKADETSSDLVFCNYITETSAGSVYEPVDSRSQSTYNRSEIENLFLPYFFGYTDNELKDYKGYCPFADYHSYNYIAIFKTEIIKNANIEFPDEKTYFNEDNLFNLSFLSIAKIISHVNGYFYHYRNNDSSFTKKFNNRYFAMKLNKFDYLKRYIIDNKLNSEYFKRLQNKICVDSVSVINYYAGARSINFREKHRWVKAVLGTSEIAQAIRVFSLNKMPFSKVKVFLILSKAKALWPIVIISSLYRLINKK